MPLYEYRCDYCGNQFDSFLRGDSHECRVCTNPARRIFSFAYKPPMPDHFSNTTGKYVRNSRDFKDQLKQMSDAATERTGIPHNYVPTDPLDMKANGVTEEGLQSTFDRADPHTKDILRKHI